MYEKAKEDELVFKAPVPNSTQLTVFRVNEFVINDVKYVIMQPLKLHEFIPDEKGISDYLKYPISSMIINTDYEVIIYINQVIIDEGPDFTNMIIYRHMFTDQKRRENRIKNLDVSKKDLIRSVNDVMDEHFGRDIHVGFLERMKEMFES